MGAACVCGSGKPETRQLTPKELSAKLMAATGRNDLTAVGLLLSAGADPNRLLKGWLPLFIAARCGFCAVAKALIAHGALVDALNAEYRITALQTAAAGGHLDVVKLLVESGASRDAVDRDGFTAMHWAAKCGHLLVAVYLCQSIASVYSRSRANWTPLHMAIRYGHLDVALFFLSKTEDPNFANREGWTLLHIAVWYYRGCIAMLDLLLQQGADINARNKEGANSLSMAVAKGLTSVVTFLLREDCLDTRVSKDMLTKLLHMAYVSDDEELFAAMLSRGIVGVDHTDENGESALSRAAHYDNGPLVLLLLQTGAHLCAEDHRLVRRLVVLGFRAQQVEVFATLVAKGLIDVNIAHESGISPIDLSIFSGNADVTLAFLKCGAQVDLTMKSVLRQLLDLSLRTDHVELFAYLLDKGLAQIGSGVFSEVQRHKSRKLAQHLLFMRSPRLSLLRLLSGVGIIEASSKPTSKKSRKSKISLPLVPLHFQKVMGSADMRQLIIDFY